MAGGRRRRRGRRPRARPDQLAFAAMDDFAWVLHDEAGNDLRSTQSFASKEEAEAWMGDHWSELLDEGAEAVTLRRGDESLYRMGLREE
jgi:hypothetical protein